ncbi:MAG: hypothetical protein KGI57_03005 [Hyphomicrobiales bacterium]|nr:hypothetical protein [Hyphomicrobiales bacterium]MDE2016656.1 hypothetical protein [Hyphomicrobiales bacterium]
MNAEPQVALVPALRFDDAPDLGHRARRAHWFRSAFKDAASTLGARHGIEFAVDERALMAAFFAWARIFERERPGAALDRADFSTFAGGLMFSELVRATPVRARGVPAPDAADPCAPVRAFWPEGWLYAEFCASLAGAVIEQGGAAATRAPAFVDLRFWESLRENVDAEPGLAVAFFDALMGVAPNWNSPDLFAARPAALKALERRAGAGKPQPAAP